MKYPLLLLAFCVGFVGAANAQLTFTYDDFLSTFLNTAGTTNDYSSSDLTGVAALISTNGPTKTWDFGGRTYTKSTTSNNSTLVSPSTAPLHSDPDFAGATHCLMTPGDASDPTASYLYLKLDPDGFATMGYVTDSLGKSKKVLSFTPPVLQYKFPLTYQTSWTSTSTVKSDQIPLPGAIITSKNEGVVDGYGTLLLPAIAHKNQHTPTSSNECLRLRITNTQTLTFFTLSQVTVSHSYEWFTKTGFNATVGTDTNDIPTSISYSTPNTSGVINTPLDADDIFNLHLSNNPASIETSLYYSLPADADVMVSVMDPMGNNVKMLQNGKALAGENRIPIDATALASGTYFLRVRSNSVTATRKLIISK